MYVSKTKSFRIIKRFLPMNKTQLVEHIAEQAQITKAAAGRAFDAVFGAIKNELVNGNGMSIPGFGSFSTDRREAREFRNPRTGEKIKKPSRLVAKFRPSPALKELLAPTKK